MADKIATRSDVNNLKANSFSTDLNRCPTYSEVSNISGIQIAGTYQSNQLVVLNDISLSSTKPVLFPFRYTDTSAVDNMFTGSLLDKCAFPIGYSDTNWESVDSVTFFQQHFHILKQPSTAQVSSITCKYTNGTTLSLGGNSHKITFDNSFLNSIASNPRNWFVTQVTTLSQYAGAVLFKDPNDQEVVNQNNPSYKWTHVYDTDQGSEGKGIIVQVSSGNSTEYRFIGNEIPSEDDSSVNFIPPVGEIVATQQSSSIQEMETYSCSYALGSKRGFHLSVWPYVGEVETRLASIDLDNISGIVQCSITINVSSSLGNTAYLAIGKGSMLADSNSEFIVGSIDDPVQINTGRDYVYTYLVNLSNTDSMRDIYIYVGDSNYDSIVEDMPMDPRLKSTIGDTFGNHIEEIVESYNKFYITKFRSNIRVNVLGYNNWTTEII